MNLTEALKALNEGKKIRRRGWFANTPYQLRNGVLTIGKKLCGNIILSVRDLQADDWEVGKEAGYITEDEKEYLENILRPYRDEYKFTFKKERLYRPYLEITLTPYNGDGKICIYLPLFGLNKPMFEGLDGDFLYDVDDLKLFKE